MAKILVTGNATLDIVNLVDHFPREDEELRALAQYVYPGGNATNTTTVLRQHQHHCQIACTIADDLSGRLIQQHFENTGIVFDKSLIVSNSKTPTSYISLNRENGSRTIVHFRDLPELSAQQFNHIDLDGFDWLHFEARNICQLEQIMKQAGQAGVPLSLEVEKLRPGIESLFSLADILMFSKDFARASGYNSMEDCLKHFSQCFPEKRLSCTWGDQGAMAYARGQFYHSPAYPPDRIIDTIGAGDTFNAAFIHAMLCEDSIESALEYACRLAGKKCGQNGFENLLQP